MPLKLIYKNETLDDWCCAALVKYYYTFAELKTRVPEPQVNDVFFVAGVELDPEKWTQMLENCCVIRYVNNKPPPFSPPKNKNFYISVDKKLSNSEMLFLQLTNWSYDNMPYWLKLIGRYEMRDFSDKKTLNFNYGLRAWLKHPSEESIQVKWKSLFFDDPNRQDLFKKLVQVGRWIRKYLKNNHDKLDVLPKDLM